jgi:O-methyltransferase
MMSSTFREAYEVSRSLDTLVGEDRARYLWEEALRCAGLEGEFWECGVYRGGTAALLVRALWESGHPRHLMLFDTFDGLPAPCPLVDTHDKGEFKAEFSELTKFFASAPFVTVVKGTVPLILEQVEASRSVPSRISLAHLDLDLYEGTLGALDFIWPRLVPGGVIVIDDYEWEGSIGCPGVKKAVDEFEFEGGDVYRTSDFQATAKKDA